MEILIVINAGSSSIKFQVFQNETFQVMVSGLLERLYIDGKFSMKIGNKKISEDANFPNHEIATNFLIKKLMEIGILKNISDLKGIGHRIVQGGSFFLKAKKLVESDICKIEELGALAPLHNPGASAAIRAFKKIAPKAINVADFDTAFHTSIPCENNTYAIPEQWRKKCKVKRYGAHGISYEYITNEFARIANKKVSDVNLVIAHLGNGASLAAIKNGKSYNTSMGLTPLAGLVMGSRCGDIDPSILNYVSNSLRLSLEEITTMLNKKSGLLALTGTADMRDVANKVAHKDKNSILGLKIWARQVANYITIYVNQLKGKTDAIIFTAGIGENSFIAREAILKELHIIGTKFLIQKNRAEYDKINLISSSNSKFPIYIMRTNEELLIAQKVYKELKK